jgi:hypothetical protein
MRSHCINRLGCEKTAFNQAVKEFSNGVINKPDELDYLT